MMPLSLDDTLSNRPLILMSDYDGTLTPITADYTKAQISDEGLTLLRQVANTPGIQLAIVSGRSVPSLLHFLRSLVGEPIYLVGLHGGEIYNMQNGQYLLQPSPSYIESVQKLKDDLINAKVDALPGIMIEDKVYSLGLHYRKASELDAELALNQLKKGMHMLSLASEFTLRPGKQLLEAVPKAFNKGTGIDRLIDLLKGHFETTPAKIYYGDDITDFDAFRAIKKYPEGYAVYVGPVLPPSAPAVDCCLKDVQAVYDSLRFAIHPLKSDLKIS